MRTIRTAFFLMIIAVAFSSCDEPTTPQVGNETIAPQALTRNVATDTMGYTYESIAGSEIQLAKLLDEEGNVKESGLMLNGYKTGMWVYNHAGTNYPAVQISFVNDRRNGPYFEFNVRGQTLLMAYYKDNNLHGPWAKFRFGSAEKSMNYTEGKKDGIYREFDFRNGKLLKEILFKNDVEDGFMRNYDDNGKIIVEYVYKNGKRISGGPVQ